MRESHPRYGEIRNFPKPNWVTEQEETRWVGRLAEWAKCSEPIAVPDDFWKNHLRLGRYLLTLDNSGKAGLFDIVKDPDRAKDLSQQKPRAMRSLQKLHNHINPPPKR